jgi:serine/threonine-protein kinase PknG
LAQCEALYRFLAKATRSAPQQRFQSAAEMAEQLVGVLRHAADAGELPRIDSEFFDPDSDPGIASTNHQGHDGIPRLKVDRSDAAANIILAAGAVGDPARRLAMFERALQQHPGSMELALRRIDELVSMGRFADAERFIAEVQKAHPDDWRLAWYRGRALLAQGKTAETLAEFERILDEMPGELAPRQAVARAYEAGGHLDEAARYYDGVSRADASFTGAAFGLARCLERKGDRPGAADAYRLVPSTSSRFVAAQLALARLLLHGDGSKVTLDEVRGASEAIEAVGGQVEGVELHELRAEVLVKAARLAEGGLKATTHVLGLPLRPKMLRRAAEEELRACARLAVVESERIRWIDEANGVRPVTWV